MLLGEQRWQEARHWLLQALALGHLKFLRKAADELERAGIAQIADIVQDYARRCAELEKEGNASGNG